MLVDERDVYSQHKLDLGKTRQKFHVPLKPKVEPKRPRPGKVPSHLKERLENLFTQLKLAVVRESGDDDEMGSLLVNPIILIPKNDCEISYTSTILHLNNRAYNYRLALRTSADDHD